MSDPADLRAFLDHAWQRLSRGVADRRSDARNVAFATVSSEGMPEVRTVVLRAARQSRAVVEVHTDVASAKIAALEAGSDAQLMIWDARAKLQLRLSARVEILGGEAVADIWAKVPEASRVSYGKTPALASPIEHPHAYEVLSDRDAFRVLRCHLQRIDLVELGEIHRRAIFHANMDWRGEWVVP